MQLVYVLMAIVAILSLISGFTTLMGATSGYRCKALIYFIFSIIVCVWMGCEAFIGIRDSVLLTYILPIIYLCLLAVYAGWVLYELKHASRKRDRSAYGTLLSGVIISAALTAIFGLVLPSFNIYIPHWLASASFIFVIMAHFYAVLRYRLLIIDLIWLRILAYSVLIGLAAILYMVIFFLVLTGLFKFPADSSSTIMILNFIMILIVLMLIPVINETMAYLRSLTMVGQVDLAYIVKRLNRMATQNVNLNEFASFLADHLHFKYIGLVINGRVYGSSSLSITADELAEISVLEPKDNNSAWQKIDEQSKELFERLELTAVAELRNAKGRPFGQILVGKPLGKEKFEHRDLVQLGMIVNLVASIIDSKRRLEA